MQVCDDIDPCFAILLRWTIDVLPYSVRQELCHFGRIELLTVDNSCLS